MPKRTIAETRSTAPTADDSGRMLLQLITPGVGSSGAYPAAVLEAAAGPKVFPAGLHCYLDHPTATESFDRPERSVRDLAATLVEDARWDADAQALVAEARVFGSYRQPLSEMAAADAIGMSIRASAVVEEGEYEGRQMPVVQELVEGLSVDFVTHAGRGGKVLQVLESARVQPIGEAGATYRDRQEQLTNALREKYPSTESDPQWVWVRDFDDAQVWFTLESNDESGTYQFAYTDTDGTLALTGDAVEVRVQTSYVPIETASESAAPGADPAPPADPEPAGEQPPCDPGEPPTEDNPDPDAGEGKQETPPDSAPAPNPAEEGTVPPITEAEAAQLTEARDRHQAAATEAQRERDEAIARARRSEARESARPLIAARVRSTVPTEYQPVIADEVAEAVLTDVPLTDAGDVDQRRLTIRTDDAIHRATERMARALEAAGVGRPVGLGLSTTDTEISEADYDKVAAATFGRTAVKGN